MYLNLIQIAESFGVSETVVEGWVRDEEMPHTLDRTRLLFDRGQVVQWAAARGLATRAGFLATENSAFATGCQLVPLLRAGGIWRDVPGVEVLDVLNKIVAALPNATPPVLQLLAQRLRAKGGVTWAPVGRGFALPHPSARITLGRDSGTVALLFLRDGLPQAEPVPDAVSVRWLFFFIAPSPRAHIDLLGRLSRGLASGVLSKPVVEGAKDELIFEGAAAADAAGSQEGKR